jgi:hypothetical protein
MALSQLILYRLCSGLNRKDRPFQLYKKLNSRLPITVAVWPLEGAKGKKLQISIL